MRLSWTLSECLSVGLLPLGFWSFSLPCCDFRMRKNPLLMCDKCGVVSWYVIGTFCNFGPALQPVCQCYISKCYLKLLSLAIYILHVNSKEKNNVKKIYWNQKQLLPHSQRTTLHTCCWPGTSFLDSTILREEISHLRLSLLLTPTKNGSSFCLLWYKVTVWKFGNNSPPMIHEFSVRVTGKPPKETHITTLETFY